jgi:hypothetical protein
MRFLKRQTLDRRTANNTTLYSDAARANVYVSPAGAGSLVLPNGTTAQQPAAPSTGMIRYNTTTNEVEVYQGSTASWRTIRYKEPGLITLQNLGAGDNLTVYFGPLNPAPAAVAQSGVTWDVVQMAKNLIVIVENVIQIAGSNYLVTQNPTISGATYTATNNKAIAIAGTSVYFSIWMTGSIAASGSNGSSVTLTVGAINSGSQAQLAVGQQIANAQTGTVYGTINALVGGTGGTGTYTLTSNGVYSAIPATTALVATSVGGTIAYPSVDLIGASVSTSSILTVLTAAVSGNVATLTFTNLGSTPFAVGQIITVDGVTNFNGPFTVLASPAPSATSVSYALVLSNQAGTVTASSKVSGAYSTYIPTSTTISGTLSASSNTFTLGTSTTLTVNQRIQISGTQGGAGSITGYPATTTYYIIVTNGTTTFQLSTTIGGTAVTATGGSITGLTLTTFPTVVSYTTDSISGALTSTTLAIGTTSQIIPQGMTFTLVDATNTISNNSYYLQFTEPVPLGKTVNVLHGFDR